MADRRSRPRAGLTREKILDAAIAFVDERGLAALSTRKLGAELGVEGMTLYHYVPSKAALLDGMVERILEMAAADLVLDGSRPWTEAVRGHARGLYRTLRAHPGVLGILATRPVSSPGALRMLEAALAVLCEQGVPLGRAMDVLNAVTVFVIGHTLAEVGDTPGHEGDPVEAPGPLDPVEFPYFAEVLATGAGLDFATRFELTLGILVDGFAAAPAGDGSPYTPADDEGDVDGDQGDHRR
jgi:TetR/AcrR family transcriptional regulator, tetracycline repressor protein